MPRRKELQINYPVAMTRKVTLYHNLTQIHYQRFYEQASARMASIQGLRVNEDTDEEIARIEEVFRSVLGNANETVTALETQWKKRLEDTGFDPDLDSLQGGVTFDAPVTTPWSNRYLEIYRGVDRALMLIEMAWVSEEIGSMLDKRNAVNEARKPLVDSARQVQRAVTQAFQEARARNDKREVSKRVPQGWGDAGQLIATRAPEVFDVLRECSAEDRKLFDKLIDGFKQQLSDEELSAAIDEVAQIIINGPDESEASTDPSEEDSDGDELLKDAAGDATA